MCRLNERLGEGSKNSKFNEYVRMFAKNHSLDISEALKQPMVQAYEQVCFAETINLATFMKESENE